MSPRKNRKEERDKKRALRKKRLAKRGGKAVVAVRLGEDPLTRAAKRDRMQMWVIPLFLALAAMLHVLFGAGVGVIAKSFAMGDRAAKPEKITVEIHEFPEKKPEVKKEPEVKEEVVKEEPAVKEEVVKPKPKPKAEPKKPKKKPKNPEPEIPPKPPAPPPPRKVVGLDLGSTVEGGKGPSFATGNSQDGTTASTAVDPKLVKDNPGTSTEPVRGPTKPGPNRRATIIPQKGVKLVKPKRKQRVKPKYPATLKAQGIEANVIVEVEILASGTVKSVKIISPAKENEFNKAAKAAAMQEVFSPATKNGTAIPFRLTFTYRYRISD